MRVDGDTATVGITGYATEQLGDVVFVELPEAGKTLAQGDVAASVESVKAASDVYSPVSGEVVETNGALEESPQTVNEAPEGGGWFHEAPLADHERDRRADGRSGLPRLSRNALRTDDGARI